MNRSEKIAQHIAARIVRNKTKLHFSHLHADALQELFPMTTRNTCTTTGLSVGDSEATRTPLQTDAQPNAASEGTRPVPASAQDGGRNSGMTVRAQIPSPTVQPVGRKTLEGSTPGDFRTDVSKCADAAVSKIANPPGPREQMRGQQNSKHYDENGKGFRSTEGASPDSDAGN